MKKKEIFTAISAFVCVLIFTQASQPQTKSGAVKKFAYASSSALDKPLRAQIIDGLPSGWSKLENISNTPTDSEVAIGSVDDKGNAYCAWTEWYDSSGNKRDIMFTTNKSGSWAIPTGTPLVYTAIGDVGFPSLAVTPNGNNVLVAWHDADFSVGHMSILAKEIVGGTAGPVQNISGAGDAAAYVTLAANPVDNSLYAVWQADVGGFALKYRYKDGTTGQWSSPAFINGGQPGGQYLANLHIDRNGTAHLVYITRAGNAVVWYTKNATPKNPSTWTTPKAVSEDTGLNWTYPKVTADGDGDIYVVWQELDRAYSEIFLRSTIDGSWQPEMNLSALSELSETADVAVNGATNEIYVIWQTAFGHAAGGPVNWDVVMKTYEIDKADGKKKWSDNYRLTRYPGHAGEPQIKITKDGDLHVFFFDNAVGDFLAEIYHSAKLAPKLYAVQAPSVTSKLNKVVFAREKFNTVSFIKNPDNDDTKIQEYRIYSKKAEDNDSAFAVVGTLSPSVFQYVDKKLPVKQKYAYLVGVVNKDGLELKSAATIEN